MMPIVDGLEVEFAGQVDVVRLDAAEPVNVELQTELGVRGHPSFVVLDANNAPVARFIGPQTVEMLWEAMAAAVSSAP